MWNRGNAEYEDFMNELPTLDVIPLVFDSMALTQPEVAELKRTIALCAQLSGQMNFALILRAIVLATCSASSESPF